MKLQCICKIIISMKQQALLGNNSTLSLRSHRFQPEPSLQLPKMLFLLPFHKSQHPASPCPASIVPWIGNIWSQFICTNCKWTLSLFLLLFSCTYLEKGLTFKCTLELIRERTPTTLCSMKQSEMKHPCDTIESTIYEKFLKKGQDKAMTASKYNQNVP